MDKDSRVLGKGTSGTVRQGIKRDKDSSSASAASDIAASAAAPTVFVAVKSMPRADFTTEATLRQLDREVRIQRMVGGHPNILPLLGGPFLDDSEVHLVLPFCSGGELYEAISSSGAADSFITEPCAVALVKMMVNAVAFCHSKGVCHRDLKPQNFLFESKPCLLGTSSSSSSSSSSSPASSLHGLPALLLCDFGLAETVGTPDDPHRETMDEMCGTFNYMAPEVFGKCYTRCADLWSLGVIAHILLLGRPPYKPRVRHAFERDPAKRRQAVPLPIVWAEEDWADRSPMAQAFVAGLLCEDPFTRTTADAAQRHPWLLQEEEEEEEEEEEGEGGACREASINMQEHQVVVGGGGGGGGAGAAAARSHIVGRQLGEKQKDSKQRERGGEEAAGGSDSGGDDLLPPPPPPSRAPLLERQDSLFAKFGDFQWYVAQEKLHTAAIRVASKLVTAAEVRQMKVMFVAMDVSQTGRLTENDILAATQAAGVGTVGLGGAIGDLGKADDAAGDGAKAAARKLFRAMDVKERGEVQYYDFQAFVLRKNMLGVGHSIWQIAAELCAQEDGGAAVGGGANEAAGAAGAAGAAETAAGGTLGPSTAASSPVPEAVPMRRIEDALGVDHGSLWLLVNALLPEVEWPSSPSSSSLISLSVFAQLLEKVLSDDVISQAVHRLGAAASMARPPVVGRQGSGSSRQDSDIDVAAAAAAAGGGRGGAGEGLGATGGTAGSDSGAGAGGSGCDAALEVHVGITCDVCDCFPIIGTRFKCDGCENFDMCEECLRDGEHRHDPAHSFSRMPVNPERIRRRQSDLIAMLKEHADTR